MKDRLARLAEIVGAIATELGCAVPDTSVDCVERDGMLFVTVAGASAPLGPPYAPWRIADRTWREVNALAARAYRL